MTSGDHNHDERDPAVVQSQRLMLRGNAVDTLKEIRAALARTTSVLEAKDIRAKVEAVRRYAKEAGNRDLELLAAQGRLEAERRAGEILIETAANGGRRPKNPEFQNGTRLPQLADLGISKKQSMLWQGLARLPEERIDGLLKEIARLAGNFSTTRVLQVATGKTKHSVHFSSGTAEWLTPPEIVEATLAVLDEIDLDPAQRRPLPARSSTSPPRPISPSSTTA